LSGHRRKHPQVSEYAWTFIHQEKTIGTNNHWQACACFEKERSDWWFLKFTEEALFVFLSEVRAKATRSGAEKAKGEGVKFNKP